MDLVLIAPQSIVLRASILDRVENVGVRVTP